MAHVDGVSLTKIFHFAIWSLLLSLTITSLAAAKNPVPLINQPLVPDSVKPGSAGFTLTVNGTGFVSGSVVKWNGTALATTLVNGSHLTASVPARNITNAGTAVITVSNPGPGGASNPVPFEVTPRSSSIALARTDYGTGIAYSAAVADFNGDGKLDLALPDYDSNNVNVLLGNGDGSFRGQVGYTVGGSYSWSVAVGDFNADGKPDLAVTSAGLSVLLGNGDGTFQPHVDYATGGFPQSIAIADFNRDGKLDIVVANYSDDTVSVLLGNGDGSFQTQMTYGTGTNPVSVVVGDFNRDGKLDLATADSNSSTISILLGNGDGTFQEPVSYGLGSVPNCAAVGDFNDDGKLDLAVASSNGVSILLGDGDGTFHAHVDYAIGIWASGVVLGDFNGDNKVDLALTDQTSSGVDVLFGNGDGTFKIPTYYTTESQPAALTAGDFNDDGRLDLAVAADLVSVLVQVPIVSLSKASLTFSEQLVGTTSPAQTVTLKNSSGLPLKISSIAMTGMDAKDFSQTNTCGSGLGPGAKCAIKVTFKPTAVGPRIASVTITDNAAGSQQQIPLNGTGIVSGPNATLSPLSLTFPTQLVGKTSAAKLIMLSNYGTATLDINDITIIGKEANEFSQANNCGNSVAPRSSCNIKVTFTPAQIGTRSATLSISDNAPRSPQTASLTGKGTIVQLKPASLNFGNVLKFHSKTLTTKLTNTGRTVLTIYSIMIVDHPDVFSQTNNCGSSVAAGKSCTINVSFSPKGVGNLTSTLSISDNGGGSPQQVALSGTGIKGQLGDSARSALAAQQTARVPNPTGSNKVGTRVIDFFDFTRNDPFLANGTKRELLLRLWYPASLDPGCEPAPYNANRVWSYFSKLLAVPLPEVSTNSCQDAPVLEGAHPLVVFTHGYTATFTDYTFIFEDLASRGYVVVSVDHTYEATAEEFPDGRFVTSLLGSHLSKTTLRGDVRTLSMALEVRLNDIRSVLDELARLNAENDRPFAGKFDMSRIAVAGHSLGAVTALLSIERDARIRAGVIMDGWPDSLRMGTTTPVLLLAAGHRQWSDVEQRLWDKLGGPRIAVNLKETEHVTPTDAIWLAKGAVRTGSMGPEKTIAAIRDYIAAFLDQNLLGRPANRLMTEPSADYPDAEVRMQKQSLSP
jgi:predicted dienelactone hydrolase